LAANGTAAYEAVITVHDGRDNPVFNQEVTFSPLAPGLTASPGPYLTDVDGIVRVSFTATSAGSYGVSVSVVGDQIGAEKFLEFATPTPAPVVNPSNGSSVTGTAEPGSTVTVTDGSGTVLCTATADPVTGAFDCVISPPAPNGQH
jgi:adhesin/invasin